MQLVKKTFSLNCATCFDSKGAPTSFVYKYVIEGPEHVCNVL